MPGRKSSPHVTLASDRSRTLGDRLRQARQQAHLTQEALAQAANVGTEHIQRIERGAANPTLATLYALSDALGIGIVDLLPE